MKLALVGVGNAGSRIVNQVLAFEKRSGRDLCHGNTLLVNSTAPTFDATERVPEERRLTIGDVQWDGESVDIDGDPDRAAEVAREEKHEIIRACDLIEFNDVDGVLVVAGLAGGTGGGAGAVVIEHLKSICDEPVYGVGVLPSEAEGQRPALTAARTLQSFVEQADNVVTFDNDAWGVESPLDATGTTDATDAEDDDSVEADASASPGARAGSDTYASVNVALAERLVTLFAPGDFGGASTHESRPDPSDIMRTLDTGGLSSIGYASVDVAPSSGVGSWLHALFDALPWSSDYGADDEDEVTDAARINSLVRQAARSKLTLPCEISSADRALIVLSGPARTLSRKGFESGRYWLEREADIVDVTAGDEPHDRSTTLTAVVLFSNVTEVPRIGAMHETALDYEGERDRERDHEDDQGDEQERAGNAEEWRFGTANPR